MGVMIYVLVILPAGVAFAQAPSSDEPESVSQSQSGSQPQAVRYSVFPVAGYTSDYGLFGGAFGQRINYGDWERSFLSNTRVDFVISTKGNFSGKLDHERTQSFGTDIRSRFSIAGARHRQTYYFGIGNNSNYSGDLFDDGIFFYEQRKLLLNISARKQIADFGLDGHLDLLGSVSFARVNALTHGEESLLGTERPAGLGAGWVNKLGFGVIIEDRDSEFIPTEGFRYEAVVELSQSMFGSDFSFTGARVDLRHYVALFGSWVLAQNILLEHAAGDVPFWELPAIGDQRGLRGYHQDRFRGDSSLLHLLELRTWLFSFLDGDIQVGGQLFWDTGRVWSGFDSNRIFNDWKHTFGVGVTMSVFNRDFILRGDVGFSDETFRIYAGMGYLF